MRDFYNSGGKSLMRKVGIVFAAALLARVVVLVWLLVIGGEQQLVFGDTTRYLTLADNTLSGVGYVYDGILESFRLPGYPAFFMVLRFLDVPLFIGSLVQILAASGIAVWALWFARTRLRLSENASFIVGLLAALEPVQVYYSVVLLPDAFYTIAFLAVFTLTILLWEKGTLVYAFAIGAAIAIGNYIRPVMAFAPLLLATATVGIAALKGSVRRGIVIGAVIWITTFALMTPWYLRNLDAFGHFKLSSTTEQNLFFYNAAAVEASVRQVPYATVKQEFVERASRDAPSSDISTFENSSYYKTQAVEIIRAHPFVFAKLYALGVFAFWTSGNYQYIFKNLKLLDPPSQSVSYSMMLSSEGAPAVLHSLASKITEPFILIALFDRLFWLGLFVLFIGGLYIYRQKPETWLVVLFAAYYCATILPAVLGIEARHRYSLIPIMLCYAIAFAVAARSRFSRTINRA